MTTKTQALIEHTMMADEGDGYRAHLKDAVNSCSDAFRVGDKPFRKHLGASLIGRKCPRELWYSFRWFTRTIHTGRMQRLFNRGHLEEGRFIAMLRSVGITVWCEDEAGNQFRMKECDGHFGGSLDSVLVDTPDFPPGTAILGEYKTHGEKSFLKLKREGVKKAKWEHYVQMQLYMNAYSLPAGIYIAVNKNNDEIYTEILYAEPHIYEKYVDRAGKIIFTHTPPDRISTSKTHFECKFCDHYNVCHNQYTPEVNCRTCKYSMPVSNGEWQCNRHNAIIPVDFQYHGCEDHEFREY